MYRERAKIVLCFHREQMHRWSCRATVLIAWQGHSCAAYACICWLKLANSCWMHERGFVLKPCIRNYRVFAVVPPLELLQHATAETVLLQASQKLWNKACRSTKMRAGRKIHQLRFLAWMTEPTTALISADLYEYFHTDSRQGQPERQEEHSSVQYWFSILIWLVQYSLTCLIMTRAWSHMKIPAAHCQNVHASWGHQPSARNVLCKQVQDQCLCATAAPD